MGGACSTYGREVYTGFWCGNLKESDHFEDPGLDGRIILRWSFRSCYVGGMDWIYVTQNRDRWRAVMILRVP